MVIRLTQQPSKLSPSAWAYCTSMVTHVRSTRSSLVQRMGPSYPGQEQQLVLGVPCNMSFVLQRLMAEDEATRRPRQSRRRVPVQISP